MAPAANECMGIFVWVLKLPQIIQKKTERLFIPNICSICL